MLPRFQQLGIDDSYIQTVVLQIAERSCSIYLDGATNPLDSNRSKKPDELSAYGPAILQFRGVRSVACLEGQYSLNSCIVNHDVMQLDEGYLQFTIVVTGGSDNSTFMRTLVIIAEAFSLVAA